jgi:hypothetical protein
VEDSEDIAAGALARDSCGEVGPLLEADAAHVAGTTRSTMTACSLRIPRSYGREDRERREIGELIRGPKGIFDISHDFFLLFNQKFLF